MVLTLNAIRTNCLNRLCYPRIALYYSQDHMAVESPHSYHTTHWVAPSTKQSLLLLTAQCLSPATSITHAAAVSALCGAVGVGEGWREVGGKSGLAFKPGFSGNTKYSLESWVAGGPLLLD